MKAGRAGKAEKARKIGKAEKAGKIGKAGRIENAGKNGEEKWNFGKFSFVVFRISYLFIIFAPLLK